MKKLYTIASVGCLLLANCFSISAQYDTLTNFGGNNGKNPKGSMVMIGNELFGMTQFGGTSGDGNVISVKINHSRYNNAFNFTGANGQNPYGSLTYSGAGHTVYGMTYAGGAHTYGCVFSMDTNGGNFKDLWDFNTPPSTNGANPEGSLILSHNKLFGMTYGGGVNSVGNIFSIDTNGGGGGVYKDLYDFSVANGDDPVGSLLLIGSHLYGMTEFGGTNNDGVIFSIDTLGGHYTDRWNFGPLATTNGAYPEGSLILIGPELYGMSSTGGLSGQGNVFSVDTGGVNYKDRWDFAAGNDTNGANPYGDLMLHGKVLFGMTTGGGVNDLGNIFRIDTDGTRYHNLWSFAAATGKTPLGNLTLSNVTLFGMTQFGGTGNDGVVFYDSLIKITTTDTNITCNGSNNGHGTVYVQGGMTPLTYSWTGGSTKDKATGLSAGSYTVTVTDNDGFTATASFGITQPPALTFTSVPTVFNVLCNGGVGSETETTPIGGTTPYVYAWTPSGGTNLFAPNLTAGTYTITVTDKQGCTASTSASITQPTVLTATRFTIPDDGSGDGVAAVTASGGVQPYTYAWAPGGGTTDTIKNLIARKYCCTITDNHNCSINVCDTVTSTAGIAGITSNSTKITIYPNPNNGQFTILQSSIANAKSSVEIYNVLGEMIKNIGLTGTTNQIDLSAQPEGIYLYRVISENGNLIGQGKLIIQK